MHSVVAWLHLLTLATGWGQRLDQLEHHRLLLLDGIQQLCMLLLLDLLLLSVQLLEARYLLL